MCTSRGVRRAGFGLLLLLITVCATSARARVGESVVPQISRVAPSERFAGGYEMALTRSGERRWLEQRLLRFLGPAVTAEHPVVAGALSFLRLWGEQHGLAITATVSRAVKGERTLTLQADRGPTTVVATLTQVRGSPDGGKEQLKLKTYEAYNRPEGGLTHPSTEIASTFYPRVPVAAQRFLGLPGAEDLYGVYGLTRRRSEAVAGDWRLNIVYEAAFWTASTGFLKEWAPLNF